MMMSSSSGEGGSSNSNKPDLKTAAGKIHGADQYRKGQTLLTAKLKLPGGKTENVAVPNSKAGWRDLQKEVAKKLGFKALDTYAPGSDIHAEGNLAEYVKRTGATVEEWAISRGTGGTSTVCNEGCKNFTKNWGPQIGVDK